LPGLARQTLRGVARSRRAALAALSPLSAALLVAVGLRLRFSHGAALALGARSTQPFVAIETLVRLCLGIGAAESARAARVTRSAWIVRLISHLEPPWLMMTLV
jgi:hypothetical protein